VILRSFCSKTKCGCGPPHEMSHHLDMRFMIYHMEKEEINENVLITLMGSPFIEET
jgi:hypothetical protein